MNDQNQTFSDIAQRVLSGVRLSDEDALFLYQYDNLLELGELADSVNRRKNEDVVFYNVNRHINPTNVCIKSCKFCAFSRKPGDEGAYEYSIEDIISKATEVVAAGATEVHMVGGLHPRWNFSKYVEILATLREHFPSLHLKAFTAVEIDWLAAKGRMSVKECLIQLKQAGLNSLPGGGAEIFHPEIREKICDTKTDANRWIEIHRIAHSVGLRSNCTMLYGHIESYHHRVDHMRRLRELQDETKGFNVFIPLAFQPYDNDMGIKRYTAGTDDLRNIAVARLYLDNFQHVKAYWIMLGQDIAQIALNFGANDLDGTIEEEKISRMAGGRSGMVMGKSQIQGLIRKAGKIPVERDTLYNPISTYQTLSPDQKPTSYLSGLNKASYSEFLSLEECKDLAKNAAFFDLAKCASSINSLNHSIYRSTYFIRPNKDDQSASDINIDLADRSSLFYQAGYSVLTEQIKLIKAKGRDRKIALKGIKSIWELGLQTKTEIDSLLAQLHDVGVDVIASSTYEIEDDITSGELIDFFRSCYRAGIKTAAKIEITAPHFNDSEPLWENFLSRSLALRDLQYQTQNILSVSVVPARGGRVSACEFMRAIMLARVIMFNIKDISVPFSQIPTQKDRDPKYLGATNDPAMKIAPLTQIFGGTDLGTLSYMSEDDVPELGEELRVSGLESLPMDITFGSEATL